MAMMRMASTEAPWTPGKRVLDSVLDGILRWLSARRKTGLHGHSDHRCAREPRLTVSDRLQALWPALAAMEHRNDLKALGAHSVRNDVPCAWHHELTSAG
jgi:hypothetical protein